MWIPFGFLTSIRQNGEHSHHFFMITASPFFVNAIVGLTFFSGGRSFGSWFSSRGGFLSHRSFPFGSRFASSGFLFGGRFTRGGFLSGGGFLFGGRFTRGGFLSCCGFFSGNFSFGGCLFLCNWHGNLLPKIVLGQGWLPLLKYI